MRRTRLWAGDRTQHRNGWACYLQDVCTKWRAKSAGQAGDSRARRPAEKLRKRRRTVRSQPSGAKRKGAQWPRWQRHFVQAQRAWKSDPALRTTWQARSEQYQRECTARPARPLGAVRELEPSETLWGAGSASTPLRLELLEGHVAKAKQEETSPPPETHPLAGHIPGPTRQARRAILAQDSQSAVGDPSLPGSLPKLVVPLTCWQKHPGLCSTKHQAVYETVLHIQTNFNCLFAGRSGSHGCGRAARGIFR